MAEEWYDGAYFSRSLTLRFGDCDCRREASLYTLMKLLSECAGDDYEGRGLGHEALLVRGQAFLLSQMSLKIERLPVYTEKILARTWERTVKGPYFCRDFEIFGKNRETLVSGSSKWFLTDPLSREILRPASLTTGSRASDPRKSTCPDCVKIKLPNAMSLIGRRPVYRSDLDANVHVNNAVYSRIAGDYLPEPYTERDIKLFSVNFISEAKLGDTLEIYGSEAENRYIMRGEADGRVRFSCEFLF